MRMRAKACAQSTYSSWLALNKALLLEALLVHAVEVLRISEPVIALVAALLVVAGQVRGFCN